MTARLPARLQDLPPRWARFCLGIHTFAARELDCDFASQSCLLAVSGGADSTALLRLCALLAPRHGGTLHVAHLDHGLRPESGLDAEFVRALCADLGIPVTMERRDVSALAAERGLGLEESGRLARYEFLEHTRQACGAETILLAHQLGDLAEDQLMRMARGVGWPALGGMAARDAERRLLRPLLLTPRADLEGFLRALNQPWRDDPTNALPVCSRNRTRHEVLPGLLRENPNYLSAAARLWKQARSDEEHWRRALAAFAPQKTGNREYLLSATDLDAVSSATRLRAFKQVLEFLGPGQPLGDGLFRLDGLWRSRATGKALRFPGDKEARITRSGVRFRVIDRKKECG